MLTVGNVSLSTIVTVVELGDPSVSAEGLLRLTEKVSLLSTVVSFVTVITILAVATPAAKLSVPVRAV